MSPVLFTLTLGLLLMTPGPTNTLLALAGARRDRRTAFDCIGAELAGYCVTVLPIHFLAAPYLVAHPIAGQVLAAVSALWVAVLGTRLWDASLFAGDAHTVSPRIVFLTTVFNPKGLVIALVLLPSGEGAALLQCLFLMVVLIPAAATVWLTLGAGVIHRISRHYPLFVARMASAALLLFSAGLAGKAAGLI